MTDETHCKLCGWSDDQPKAELAMEFFGLWKRGERCRLPLTDVSVKGSEPTLMVCTQHHTANEHAFPCPDPLHDDAVAMRLLTAMKSVHVIVMWRDQLWHVGTTVRYSSKTQMVSDADLKLAIVRAAAALAQQK